ncbi:MAG TPA: protein-glutamate O-methyltransferase [Opitutaceae bacterium]|nr:protein-glutamate O-methyltransferase [Opitutaceae bacterium]
MRESEFDFIRTLVYERSRISLGADKRELVGARLGKRLRATQLDSVGDYCRLLQSPGAGDELAHLIDAISTNHTFFFREAQHFDFVTARALPELGQRARAERWPRLYAWSAACSSGEEPYSLAITLSQGLAGTGWDWRIEATDISHRILDRARAAIYREEAVARIPAATVRQHFQRGVGPQAGNFRVRPELRAHVMFHHLNLLEGEPPFRDPFQLIFCRNVMIYFDRPTQEELVDRLTRRLVPGGYLFVGHSESLAGIRHSLQMVQPAVYRRPPASSP